MCAPPMFLSAVKETEEELESKRVKLDESALPSAALHQMVPLENGAKAKAEQAAACEAIVAAGGTMALAPDVQFDGSHKAQRVKTKHMLLALNQSLGKMLGFRWGDCMPSVPLRPLELGEQRLFHTTADGRRMPFYYAKETGNVVWQSAKTTAFRSHLRVASVMDEGSSSYSLIASLAEHCAVLPIRDSMHKMHRVQELTFASHEALTRLRREVFLCLKLDRAPWSTSRFGRRLKEAAANYALEMKPDDALLAPFLHSIASDLAIAPEDFASIQDAVLAFADRGRGKGMSQDYDQGRWEAFFDGARVLLRLVSWGFIRVCFQVKYS